MLASAILLCLVRQGILSEPKTVVEVGPEAYAIRDGKKTRGFRPPVYTLSTDETLEFKAYENGSTGYAWSGPTFKPSGVLGMPETAPLRGSEPTLPGQPLMVGAGGDVAFRFRPIKTGRTLVEMSYERPWMKNHSARAHLVRFVVVVKPAG